jgi:hypothetical protein
MEAREATLSDGGSHGQQNAGAVNFIAGAALAAVSGLLLVVAYQPHKESLTSSLDTMYWPRLVLWGLFAMSLILAAFPLWRTKETHAAGPSSGLEGDRWPLIAIACCTLYFILLGIAGFLISSFLFGAVFPLLLGARRWLRAVAFSLAMTAVVWLVVIHFMHVLLPRGVGAFRTFSLLFY